MEEVTEKHVPPRMSEEDLQKMVLALVSGQVFTATQAPADMLTSIFLPLALGAMGNIDWDQVGNVVEHMDKAGHYAVNGYPTFLSCQLIHKDDWTIIADRALATDAAMRAAAGGGS